jgi:hypothetical protein
MFSLFKKEKDIEFVDISRNAYQKFPVMLAKDVPTLGKDTRIEKHGINKFAHCPGMIDYANMGYIIPAWVDIHIKANKAGTVYRTGSAKRGDRGYAQPRKMDQTIVDGMLNVEDGIDLTVLHIGSPWHIFTSKNVSALLLPASYHSPFLADLHIWPGAVDYKNFHSANLICSPKRECEIHIKAGEPLLHVIPFLNKDMLSGYGPGTNQQVDSINSQITSGDSQYYRKYLGIKKFFGLDKTED